MGPHVGDLTSMNRRGFFFATAGVLVAPLAIWHKKASAETSFQPWRTYTVVDPANPGDVLHIRKRYLGDVLPDGSRILRGGCRRGKSLTMPRNWRPIYHDKHGPYVCDGIKYSQKDWEVHCSRGCEGHQQTEDRIGPACV